MKTNYSYNIHNIVTVSSDGELPELQPFLVKNEMRQMKIRNDQS